MTTQQEPAPVEFMYDAIRKVATARARDAQGKNWMVEFIARGEDDSMEISVRKPDGGSRKLKVNEDDFRFSDNTVTIASADTPLLFMTPLYLRKMRGFTRGNIPTPDIAGPTLP